MNEIKELYYDPKQGLRGVDVLYEKLKKKYTKKQIKEVLQKQEAYQINTSTKRISYHPITGKENSYQADITFYDQYSKYNAGYTAILVFIEITTRKAFCYAIKNKTKAEIVSVFKTFLEDAVKVDILTTDQGSEFTSKSFIKAVSDAGITQYFSEVGDKTQMGKVERFNRTLRDMITRYMTAHNTVVWYKVLPDLVSNYNSSKHASIGVAPNEVDSSKAEVIRKAESNRQRKSHEEFLKFKVGDRVRVQNDRGLFDKGSQTFSSDIYTIKSISGYSFTVVDEKGNEAPKRYKHYEIKKVQDVERLETEEKISKRRVENEAKHDKKLASMAKQLDAKVENGSIVLPSTLQVQENTDGVRRSGRKVEARNIPFMVNFVE